MIDDLKKSIASILYERTTSPFFGTLICSWLLWNWKIVYLTIFISEDKIETDKIEYILTNYSNIHNLTTYPLLSSLVLMTLIPFASNGAYWLSLRFTKWKKDQKNIIEMQQLLTIEQSIELREQISEQEVRFEKLLKNKDLEIKQLKLIIETNKKETTPKEVNTNNETPNNSTDEILELSKRVRDRSNEKEEYSKMIKYIQKGYQMSGDAAPSTEFIALMESYDIIQNSGGGRYQLTETGKMFHRLMAK